MNSFFKLVLLPTLVYWFPLGGFSADNAPADFDTLSSLLRELREIRKTKYTLQAQWKDEKEQLELIKKLEEEKLKVMKESEKNAQETLTRLKINLSDTSKQSQTVNESASQLRDWIDKSCQTFLDQASQFPILLNEEGKKSIQAILNKDKSITDKLVLYLNLMLDTAVAGTKSKVVRRTVTVDGKPYSAEVLILGGALEYFVTPDDGLCGYRGLNGSDASWKTLDNKFVDSLRTTIRVVGNEIPPKLVSVPVPTSAIKKRTEK